LLSRYNFVPVPNRPSVPIYDLSDRDKMWLCALNSVRDKKQKMLKENAIKEVAREFNINENTLANALDGRHAGLRRKLKALKSLKSYWLARVPAELKLRSASRR
jgi:hypothetical protein